MAFGKSQNIYLHILTSDVELKNLDPMFPHVLAELGNNYENTEFGSDCL